MRTIEQRRAWVLTKVIAGEVEVAEAAELLGLSVRSVWRLKRRFGEEGPAGLVHGNRGRPSPRRIDESTRDQVRALARSRYDGANDSVAWSENQRDRQLGGLSEFGCWVWSGRRDSNPRHSAWEADTLPAELLPLGVRSCTASA